MSADERPRPPPPPRAILVECLRCGHRATVGGPDAPLDVPLVQLTRRLKCSECGSRAVKAARVETPRDVARLLRSRMDANRN